ncbi:MAG: SCO family protein [Leptospiraceae bacterium]|nr:SCO family protein [Leptospiraceae bacterium]MCK6381712.1 SCO family protein [Leptospiraceae bacterium]
MNKKGAENSTIEFISDWIASWKFPSFALFLLFFTTLLFSVVLFIPDTNDITGSFAKDFKIWCFGYNPETGEMKTIYVVMLVLDPLFLMLIIGTIWKNQLKEVITKEPKKIIPYAIFSFLIMLSFGYGFTVLAETSFQPVNNEFPAKGLRTSIPAHDFQFIDHRNHKVQLSDFKNQVLIITSFYTACGKSCPTILFQAKRVLNSLTEKEKSQVKLVAITLDPQKETKETMTKTAKGHGLDMPGVYFLNGDPILVEKVLDKYSFERRKNSENGDIDHNNLFVVIDKKGKIAYRFSLGELQEKWLKEAVRLLANEKIN